MDAGETVGRYRLMEPIGSGGMAEVYRAVQREGIAREVALKVLKPEVHLDPSLRAMFESEAELALSLRHPNIVEVLEVAEHEGRAALVLELVRGMDVAHMLHALRTTSGQPIPERFALHIAAEALAGLQHAHGVRDATGQPLDVVHRDVSPGNLLVSAEGDVKVADFGVAHSASRQSVVGAVKGKPAYMAPEQLHLAPVDARADVYAVGVVLYETVTGRRPFEGRMGETLADVSAGRFPPPRAIRPELGPDLEALILTAMARSAADRFSSAAAMGEAIRGYVAIRGHALRRADLGEFVRDLKRASADSSPPPYRPEGAERTRPSSPRSRRMQAIEG